MKCTLLLPAVLLAMSLLSFEARGGILSFEERAVPEGWSIDRGKLSVSKERFKLGNRSLEVDWKGGAELSVFAPEGIDGASAARTGGMNLWVYNEVPYDRDIVFSFRDASGDEVCSLPFHIGFRGWRCIWARFRADMGMKSGSGIASMSVVFPEDVPGGTLYLDMLEFTPKVSWQNMSDAQYSVSRTDFSLIPDFMRYRAAWEDCRNPEGYESAGLGNVIHAGAGDIDMIGKRLEDWYLGGSDASSLPDIIPAAGAGADPVQDMVAELRHYRNLSGHGFISRGVELAKEIVPQYDKTGRPVGKPLFPMASPDRIAGEKVMKFRTVNEKMLLPLALDWRVNGNVESLAKALYIYDWFNDQGWADGSAMGTLCFEKLRSSGYFHSLFLLRDRLPEKKLGRELNTLGWYSLFGMCCVRPESEGEVADNLRALSIAKLIYALSLPDADARETALTAYKRYMDNALGIAPGFFGTLKADGSGYHHRGPYNSAYYPHALYAGAFAAYLLHGTQYALDRKTLDNIKNGLLTFRFFCAGPDVPAATTGRFPEGQAVLQNLLPAFAYAALSYGEPDRELVAAFKQIIMDDSVRKEAMDYAVNVNSNLAYTSSFGELDCMARIAAMDIGPDAGPDGSLFMPYSGLLVSRDDRYHFNIKGFSRYIWDFESSATENLQGRYISYGSVEYFDRLTGRRSFNPSEPSFDWRYIPGTTARTVPVAELVDRGGASSGHRHFSDMTFLAGVTSSSGVSMFSFRLHDIAYDTTFRADKSVFVFDRFLLCMGSGISSADSVNNTVTTLFQSFDGSVSVPAPGVLDDGSFAYAARDGEVRLERDGKYARAYIDHGKAPHDGSYLYCMAKDSDSALAGNLLGGMKVLRQDSAAHIVRYGGVICGALFDAAERYDSLTVRGTNIPLAYILEEMPSDGIDGKGHDAGVRGYRLSLCEPDMRRPHRDEMGQLTEEDVLQAEQPFTTSVELSGNLRVLRHECVGKLVRNPEDTADENGFTAEYDPSRDITVLTLTTVRGENHIFDLIKAD